jgi:hypothetical protein
MVKERKNIVCAAVTRGVRVRWNCNVFNLAMENVLKGFPDKIRDQLSRHHTMWYTKQKHFKCTHFWITGDEIGVLVYIKTMQSCSSTFDTSSQSFQTGWPRSAYNFMFPLRSRRNAIHQNSSRLSPSELVFSLGERREDVYCNNWNNFYFVFKYHFVL